MHLVNLLWVLSSPAGADEGFLLGSYVIKELVSVNYLLSLGHFLRSTRHMNARTLGINQHNTETPITL